MGLEHEGTNPRGTRRRGWRWQSRPPGVSCWADLVGVYEGVRNQWGSLFGEDFYEGVSNQWGFFWRGCLWGCWSINPSNAIFVHHVTDTRGIPEVFFFFFFQRELTKNLWDFPKTKKQNQSCNYLRNVTKKIKKIKKILSLNLNPPPSHPIPKKLPSRNPVRSTE